MENNQPETTATPTDLLANFKAEILAKFKGQEPKTFGQIGDDIGGYLPDVRQSLTELVQAKQLSYETIDGIEFWSVPWTPKFQPCQIVRDTRTTERYYVIRGDVSPSDNIVTLAPVSGDPWTSIDSDVLELVGTVEPFQLTDPTDIPSWTVEGIPQVYDVPGYGLLTVFKIKGHTPEFRSWRDNTITGRDALYSHLQDMRDLTKFYSELELGHDSRVMVRTDPVFNALQFLKLFEIDPKDTLFILGRYLSWSDTWRSVVLMSAHHFATSPDMTPKAEYVSIEFNPVGGQYTFGVILTAQRSDPSEPWTVSVGGHS